MTSGDKKKSAFSGVGATVSDISTELAFIRNRVCSKCIHKISPFIFHKLIIPYQDVSFFHSLRSENIETVVFVQVFLFIYFFTLCIC